MSTIVIESKGNFNDFVTETFAITAEDLEKEGVVIKVVDKVYKKKS